MKRLRNFIAAIVISPELLVCLVLLGVFAYYPGLFESLGMKMRADDEVWKHLPALTILFSGLAFKFSSKLRAPLENQSNKVLYEWPHYRLLKDRVMVSLVFSSVSGIVGLGLWVLGRPAEPKIVGLVFLAATGTAAITALTMLLAHQTLRELLETHA